MAGLSVFYVAMSARVLWECPAYKDSREEFMIKLRSTLGEAFKDFEALKGVLLC